MQDDNMFFKLDTFLPKDQKVQAILDNSQDYWGWVLCDFQGNFIDASVDQFKEFNISKKDLIGLSISDFVDKDELEGALQFLQKVKQEGMASGIQHIKLATGEERSFEFKDVVVYEGDEPVAVRIIVRDITGKVKDNPSFKVREPTYQGVFENTGLPIILLEENLLISMVNGKFEELSGYARSEIEEKMSLSHFVEEETKERILKQFLDQPGDSSSGYECRIISRSGKTYDMIVRFGKIPSTRQMIVSFTDITSRKQTEKELKESRDHLQAEHRKDKEAFKETKERYQMIIENVDDFVFEQDLAGNFTFVNNASVKNMGYSKNELLGMNYLEYTLPEEKEIIDAYHRRIYKSDTPGKGLQHRVIRKDGSIFYVELVSTLMKNSYGKPVGYRGISRDITARKLAEKVLKESEQHFKEIIEGTPVPTIVFDKNYHIVHWNRACEELTGIKSDEVIGKNKQVTEKLFHRSILPESMIKDIGGEEPSKKSGLAFEKSAIIKNAYEVESFFPKLGKNGKWLFITASPLENSAGQSIGVIETILDITAMKQAEADLKKSEKKYHDFFQNVLDFIFIHDLEGNFIENNARYVMEVGGRPDIIAKSNLRDLMPEIFKPEFDDYLKRIKKNGRDDGVIAIQVPEGEIRILEYKNLLLCDEDNRPLSVLGSARDITEHIKDKKALRESKERYQMILENVGDYIYELDLAGNYTFVNEALVKRSGYSRKELIGMNYREYTFPEETESIEAYHYNIYRTGEIGKGLQHRVTRKDASPIYIELVASLIKNDHGKPIGFRGVARDITERRIAEKVLKESEQQLKEITEGSPIPTIVFNKNYHVTHWNRACEELTGIKAIDVIGQNKQVAEKFFHQPILPDFLVENVSLKDISKFYGSECRKSKIVKNAYEIELFFPELGENGKWLFLTLAFLRDPENNIIGVIETLLDVTSQKRAEKNLLKVHEALEEKVEERTKEIQEINIALEVLLKKRENDKKKFEDKVAFNIKEVLTPHIELLKKTHLDKHQKVYLEILEDNFKEIATPFMSMISDNAQKLTRTEIQVLNLIKQNKITKEIADLMGVSTRTVETHRDNIRKKLGMKNKKVNLRAFLLSSE